MKGIITFIFDIGFNKEHNNTKDPISIHKVHSIIGNILFMMQLFGKVDELQKKIQIAIKNLIF
jgi:hypothetical protein